jgi:hypothetical protein
MMRDPVPGDIDASTHPDAIVPLDVIEEALKRDETPRSPQQATMHADRHHFRPVSALGVENVESIG